MHEKLEKEFEEKVILPELERKKKYLEELKDYYRPLSRSVIMSHQHSYENLRRIKQKEYLAKREQQYPSDSKYIPHLPKTPNLGAKNLDQERLMSKFLQRAIKEDKLQRNNSPLAVQQQKREKIDKYCKLVKDLHPPKVSKVKSKEMRALRDAVVNTRVMNSKPSLREIRAKLETSGRSSKFITTVDDENKHYDSLSKFSPSRNMVSVASHIVPKSHIAWNFHNPLLPKPTEKKEGHVVDYLRMKREERSSKELEST